MEISDRIRIRMTVHRFWPTMYIRRMYGLNRIYAVYGPDRICRWCRVRIPATAVYKFALLGQFSFLAPLLTELFLCFPFLLMHMFSIII